MVRALNNIEKAKSRKKRTKQSRKIEDKLIKLRDRRRRLL